MRRRNKPYALYAWFHYIFDLTYGLLQGEFPADNGFPVAADLVILAVLALQVAAAEKYITDPALPGQYRLFAAMQTDRSYLESSSGSAIPIRPIEPVSMAFTWTANAVRETRQVFGRGSGRASVNHVNVPGAVVSANRLPENLLYFIEEFVRVKGLDNVIIAPGCKAPLGLSGIAQGG